MKILVDVKIKCLFRRLLLFAAVFLLLSAGFIGLKPEGAALYVLLACLCMGLCSLAALYAYFRDQNKVLEDAVRRLREYSAGNPDARIECEEEGELYRLFHEINSLAATLNAHAENEGSEKQFMKETISDISHQLKTPLAALNIYNGIMQEEAGDPEAVREFADLSEQELERIETLVQNLLKIAKFDAGTIVMDKRVETIRELLAPAGRHFAYQAKQEGKVFSLSGSPAAELLCDPGWLSEALGNLIKNAFDHTKAGDFIRVEWDCSPSLVRIAVSDNGSGIHPEDLYHIFKRFYRSRFSKDTQGAGLGLPLAKAIVEAHDGTIEVDSRPGAGTKFTILFSLPANIPTKL